MFEMSCLSIVHMILLSSLHLPPPSIKVQCISQEQSVHTPIPMMIDINPNQDAKRSSTFPDPKYNA